MARQATRRQQVKQSRVASHLGVRALVRLQEAAMILLTAIAGLMLLALISFNPLDPGWSHTSSLAEVKNWIGKSGAYVADIFLYLFGYFAYLFPLTVGQSAWLVYRGKQKSPFIMDMFWLIRVIGFILALVSGPSLAALHLHHKSILQMGPGGVLGQEASQLCIQFLNPVGASVTLLTLFLVGVTLSSGFSWVYFFDWLGRQCIHALFGALHLCKSKMAQMLAAKQRRVEPSLEETTEIVKPKRRVRERPLEATLEEDELIESQEQEQAPVVGLERQGRLFEVHKPQPFLKALVAPETEGLPSLDLLDPTTHDQSLGYTEEKLHELSQLVETKLLDFNIQVQVVAVSPGPVVTRFELQLAPGIKVSKLTSLSKDIARSLSVVSVRVVEVIPGKSYVGLEIPNVNREVVRLREVLESAAYAESSSPLSLALGKDISGMPIVVNLAKMPHLLVAGTTGSGKSVGVNAMLVSLLFKASPQDVRLILIDPKMLELSIYEGIPHLLTPVVTDMKDAAHALKWCVAEMERRYKVMAAMGVRNLAGFNQKISDAAANGATIPDPTYQRIADEPIPQLEHLPYVVVVIDEFADMMMVVGKKVEELIARIAQKARAAGIHLILATQRPSVDVITGLIKANIPTRIAFQVSSRIDSRTILDQQGAEQLLGHGDMLYLPPGSGIPIRVHGAFISDQEVHNVVNDWRNRGKPEYIEKLSAPAGIFDEGGGEDGEDEDSDELYDKAVFIVTESRKASISSLQRRLKIGYNRSARMIERMEREGVVSATQSGGSREVLAPPPVGAMFEDEHS